LYLKKKNKYFKNITKVIKFKGKYFKDLKSTLLVPLIIKNNLKAQNKKQKKVSFHYVFKKKKQFKYNARLFLQNFKKKKKTPVKRKTLPKGLSFKFLNFFVFNNYTFKNSSRFYELFINHRARYRG
jgi:hypothetical protein